jgi:sulfate/thiosulfate transport system ATP-binding protein
MLGSTLIMARTKSEGFSGNTMAPQTETTQQPAISVKQLVKSFGGQPILSGVSLEIAPGEMLVVLGPSGSGKTTLLRLIAGLEQPDAGEIYLHDKCAHLLPPQQRALGVVFQEHALFQRKTVEQNIAFGLEARGVPRPEVRQIVDEMLELIGLREHRRKYPAQLSGGQRQRVALARALAFKPAALLFDEPFSALDAVTRTELRRQVRALLRQTNVPALFITHDQEEALELADRIAVLNRGQIEQIGTPFEVYNHPRNEFVATFLGAANVLLGRWQEDKVSLGRLRMQPPPDPPLLAPRQPVKIVFRPEDVILNFQPQLLDTPFYLGRGVIEDISYVGHSERLVVRLALWSPPPNGARNLAVVDETYAEGFPISVSRSKWDASELEVSVGDSVAVGLKGYRLLPHYPLRSTKGAKVYE